jgi:hypothetical protein
VHAYKADHRRQRRRAGFPVRQNLPYQRQPDRRVSGGPRRSRAYRVVSVEQKDFGARRAELDKWLASNEGRQIATNDTNAAPMTRTAGAGNTD